MNIGDYVRFDYHRVTVPILIGKIVHIEYDEVEKYYYYATDNGLVIGNENIIKSSPDITDLIQIDDYVNGSKVVEIKTDENGTKWIYTNNENAYGYKSDDIKSIVTREMFESMKYKIGE